MQQTENQWEEMTFSRYLGRHIVSLVVREKVPQKDGTWKTLRVAISGFILLSRAKWLFVTAGHNFVGEKMRRALEEGCVFDEWQISDAAGEDARDDFLIPFSFKEGEMKAVDDASSGEDYALIPLSENYVHLLQANGIQPLDEEFWSDGSCIENATYVLLGYPSQLVKWDKKARTLRLELVGIALEPSQTSEDGEDSPLFKGVLYNFRPEADDFDDIGGMSGGPIFRCWTGVNGERRYQVVAIQSSWHSDRRAITAYKVSALVPNLDTFLDSLEQSL